MDLGLSKINFKFSLKGAKNSVFEFFGSSPRKYWHWFLILFFVLLATSVIFSVFLFLSLSSAPIEEPVDIGRISEIKINLSGLEKAIDLLDERAKKFEEALSEPLFNDPSI